MKTESERRQTPLPSQLYGCGLALLLGLGCGSSTSPPISPTSHRPATSESPANDPQKQVPDLKMLAPGKGTEADIRRLCSQCHAFSHPASLPRRAWRQEVKNGYLFWQETGRSDLPVPAYEDTVAWYEARAPEWLDFSALPVDGKLSPTGRYERVDIQWPAATPIIAVAAFQFRPTVDDSPSPSLLVCDMFTGSVWEAIANTASVEPRIVAQLNNPCHIATTDLDGDGADDFLIADLGSVNPADHDKGIVWWCRPTDAGRKWDTYPIATKLGRTCDARPIDYDRDGDVDVIVADFGWHKTGSIWLLTNDGFSKSGKPKFTRSLIDPRYGAIHRPQRRWLA